MFVFLDVFSSLWGVASSLFPFVILLGILVFIHELGHFMVARFCGVRVEVFSLGFGKKILKWKKGDTVYCVSLFPLGGYVKMFGHEYGKDIPKEQQSVSFLHKKLWQRAAIVLAGPLMNFFLAVFIFAGLSMVVGERRMSPVIGEIDPSSPAGQAGLSYGDRIVSIDKVPVESVKQVKEIIFEKPEALLNVEIKNQAGEVSTRTLPSTTGEVAGKWGFLEKGGMVEGLGFSAPEALIGVIGPNSPAGQAGLKTFDKVLSINGEKIEGRKELFHILNEAPSSPDFSWKMEVQRGEETKQVVLRKPPDYQKGSAGLQQLGLARSDLFIADLKKTGAAEQAGLKKGDFIFKVNGEKVASWAFLVKQIKTFHPDQGSLKIEIKREGKLKSFSVAPEIQKQIINGIEHKRYMLGIVARFPHFPVGGQYIDKKTNPFHAIGIGLDKTFHWCAVVGVYIKKIITGEVSRRTLGGAISIGRAAYDSYFYGLEYFFRIMAILSVQLFLLNILPIPIFDGGHLLFYVIEFFNGAPLSMKKMIIAQQVGLVFLLFLLIFTTFNDLHNWFFIW